MSDPFILPVIFKEVMVFCSASEICSDNFPASIVTSFVSEKAVLHKQKQNTANIVFLFVKNLINFDYYYY